MNEALLEIRDLSLSAGDKTLVDSVSLTIPKRTVSGLVGESGSGKSLSALSILGLLPKGVKASGGKILFHSEDQERELLGASEKQLNTIRGRHISMIFQEPMTSLNPSMKCGKQAIESLVNHKKISNKEAANRIKELFKEVRLPDVDRIFSAWPHELSGGQRQRVMIAMALASNPDLLIADEPTTALDVTVQKSILELLLELKDKFNLSILFISHDLMVINQIADEVTVMYQGKVMEQGKKQHIMEHPVSAYTKGLLACKPSLDEHPKRLPTIADFMENKIQQTPDKKLFKQIKANKESILTVKNLEVTFPGRKKQELKAVNNVSFEVFKGETLGLVGESGCGKTTLGRTILQLVQASSGSVSYKGTELNKLNNRELRNLRRRIQIVFQDPYSSLNPGKTIGNIIAEPMIVHKLAKGKTDIERQCHSLLERVGLPLESMNLYPHQFSGGQRQRIGIARALACQPDFLVLDESVSALDVSVQAQVLNLLNDLKDEFQLTYIFISHDLTVVKYMSDRVMVMSSGKIIESGDATEIYRNPKNSYTKTLIASIPA